MKLINDLKDPSFKNKSYRVLFAPLVYLSHENKRKIQSFASKHWCKNPALFHRLYWSAQSI